MSYFFSRYKFYKSFRVPVLPEDKLSLNLYFTDTNLLIENISIKEVNLSHLSFVSDEKYKDNIELEVTISQKHILSTKKHQYKAKIIGSHANQELNKFVHVVEIIEETFSTFILEFIQSFKKSRLKKYLVHSSLENKEYDYEELSEIISLMKNGFHTLINDDEINFNSLLQNCTKFLKSSNASLYLINSSENKLERKHSTLVNPKIKSIDYRKGIPGIVFSSAELINIYKSKLISICPANEVTPESILAVPLFNRMKNVIGVLEFTDKSEGKRFNLNDETTISMLSIVFSSFFQMYNPVHSSSKLKVFNPGLNKKVQTIFEDETHKDTLTIIDKVKNKLESIVVNSNCKETLSLVAKEIIDTSQFHDWPLHEIDCTKSPIKFQHLENEAVLYLKEVSSLSKEDQSIILDLIERKNIWIISTYYGTQITNDKFSIDFHTAIAKHHINICHEKMEKELSLLISEFIKSQNELKSFDEKVKHFEEALELADKNDKLPNLTVA
jgi:hypothetical protein